MKNILLLSDLHLLSSENDTYKDICPNLNFLRTIDLVKSKYYLDLIILTGDISNDGSRDSYLYAKTILDKLAIPYFILPGNHDDLNIFNDVFGKISFNFNITNYALCFLNTVIPGKISGILSENVLEKLKSFLEKNTSKQVFIFMHHHPQEVNSPHMNQYILKEKELFNNLIFNYSNVSGVFFGHIHHVFEKRINNVFYASVPSTFYELEQGILEFKIKNSIPAFRMLYLGNDSFRTETVSVF